MRFWDKYGNEVTNEDLQDKGHWCKVGETFEQSFIRQYSDSLKYEINPEKIRDCFAPDLIQYKTRRIADLKVQEMPFFKASELYGIDPTFAVVFNKKDKLRYQSQYPELDIIFWVNWKAVKAKDYRNRSYQVSPLQGVFRASFWELRDYMLESKLHFYQQRKFDTLGNAKCSYVLDIRLPIFQRLD